MKVSNLTRNTLMTLAATGMVAVAAPAISNAQSTLIFDDSGLGNNTNLPGSGYGDNLVGTPNVTLTWGAGWQNYFNWDGRTTAGQLDYNVAGSNVIDLTFHSDAGFGVYVSSFDLDTWTAGGNTRIDWEILDGGTSIDSGVYLNPLGSGRTTITTNMDSSNAVFGSLTLRLTQISGLPNYQAADNITFSQVPEPTSAAVLLAGAGALAMRRRRK
jgi:hypothetical protein